MMIMVCFREWGMAHEILGDCKKQWRRRSAEEDAALGIAELEECARTLLLLELAVELHDWDVNVVQ